MGVIVQFPEATWGDFNRLPRRLRDLVNNHSRLDPVCELYFRRNWLVEDIVDIVEADAKRCQVERERELLQ